MDLFKQVSYIGTTLQTFQIKCKRGLSIFKSQLRLHICEKKCDNSFSYCGLASSSLSLFSHAPSHFPSPFHQLTNRTVYTVMRIKHFKWEIVHTETKQILKLNHTVCKSNQSTFFTVPTLILREKFVLISRRLQFFKTTTVKAP